MLAAALGGCAGPSPWGPQCPIGPPSAPIVVPPANPTRPPAATDGFTIRGQNPAAPPGGSYPASEMPGGYPRGPQPVSGGQPATISPYQPGGNSGLPAYNDPRMTNYQPPGGDPAAAAPPLPPPPGETLVSPEGLPITPAYPGFSPPSVVMPGTPTPLDVFVEETRTGRFMFGIAVNSDAGVTGQITV